MTLKFFYPNEKGNIEFTREQLEKLLNDVFDEGKEEGIRQSRPYLYLNPPSPDLPTYYYNNPIYTDSTTYSTNEDAIGRITIEIEKEMI